MDERTSTQAPVLRGGGKATIIQYCAVFGRLETPVRQWSAREPAPYAQHPIAVSVSFSEPRKQRTSFFNIVPNNTRYLTVEQDGVVVYDSRSEVPCDMQDWQAIRNDIINRFHKPA